MAVNRPESEGEARGLRCHKSLATVLSLLYIPPDWSAQRRRSLQRYTPALVTEINIATYTDVVLSSEKWLALCDRSGHAVCVDRLFSCYIICHAQLSRPSLPLQTSRPAPPPASKVHPNASNSLKKRSFHMFKVF